MPHLWALGLSMAMLENLIEKEPDLLQYAVKFDDLDECIVGYGNQYTSPPLLIYSYDLMVEHFMKDGCTYDEACEYISYNIECLWCDEGTPVILYT